MDCAEKWRGLWLEMKRRWGGEWRGGVKREEEWGVDGGRESDDALWFV